MSVEVPAWIELLGSTKIRDVIDPHPMVKTNYFEEVSVLLKKLSDSKTLSAVIVDDDPKVGVVGFVDVLDLITFVIETTEQTGKDITKETMENLKWEGKCFERGQSGHLVNLSRADPFVKISSNASLLDAVKLMTKEIHRLAVIDPGTPENTISNIISQSDIVHFITTHGIWLGTRLERSLSQVGLSALGVSTIQEDMNTLATLCHMRDFKLSGVGIVDAKGKLVANFSGTDLIGLTQDKFQYLALPVKEFIKMHGYAKPPVCCKSSDSVEILLLKMMVHKVHRVYLVDDAMLPTGIITMTDIMQFLLSTR